MHLKLYEVLINIIFTFAAGGLCIAAVVVDGLFSFPFKVLLGGGPKLGPFILLSPVSIFAPALALAVALWAYGAGLVRPDWAGFIRTGASFFCSSANITSSVTSLWWMYRLKTTILGNCITGIQLF